MPPASRAFVVAALIALALSVAGCSSNNKGRIEGRWKFTSFPEKTESQGRGKELLAKLNERGAYFYLEFRPDGTMTMGLGSDKPDVLAMLKSLAERERTKATADANFKLLPGDGVELYNLPSDFRGDGAPFGSKDRAKLVVVITGKEMTVTGPDGTATLTKIK